MDHSTGTAYLQTAIKRLKYYKSLGDSSFEQLGENDFHFQPDPGSNSIAIIIQHLHGNMLSRWTNFLTEDGEKPWRQRDEEFNPHAYPKTNLIQLWNEGWDCFLHSLQALDAGDLLKTVYIRDEPLWVIDAVNRQLAHYPYHIGQIVYIARMIKLDHWKCLSIEKGNSDDYNKSQGLKDPAKNY